MTSETWHYVRRNETTRMPRRHIFVDTEARETRVRRGHVQTWRCGVAIFRNTPKGKRHEEHTQTYRRAEDLWRDVTGFVPTKGRAILWTHNLGYDVRTSAALVLLPRMGWRVTGHNLSPGGTWLAWRRGEQSLVMVDSASVLPTSVKRIAAMIGVPHVDLPDQSDGEARWLARCTRDATILRNVIVAYLQRLETADLGNWQMTGTGQSWAAFRHKHLTHNMLIHWDAEARAAERRAMWTGRCEAYWHGKISGVRVDEWDMTLAYPRIALTHDIPVALASMLASDTDLRAALDRPGFVALCEVEVSTDVALVPCERDGRITWPVGTFVTTLWSPELRLLVESGATVRVLRGWLYRAAPALTAWAEWIIGELTAPDAHSPPWWKVIMKHWARALIGRMAMTYRQWERVAYVPHADIRRATYVDTETGQTGEAIQIGHDLFVATETVEWPESMPQITGYVMSACRAILARLLAEAGERVVLYVDTDSMLTTAEHYEAMAALAARHPESGLRLKTSWRGASIRGPRQIVTGPKVRIAGIPIGAQLAPDGSLVGEVWESLAAAVAHRRATSVRITPRRWSLRAVDARRREGKDGWTLAHVITASDSTKTAAR